MRVAIIKPLLIGHRGRGTGVYAHNLVRALLNHTKVEVVWASYASLPAKVDLWHFPYFDPFFLTLPWWRRQKTIVTVHDLIPLRFPRHFPVGIKGRIKWQIQRFLLGGVDAVITDSQASKKDIIAYVGVSGRKIFPIYLAPATEFLKARDKSEKQSILAKYHLPQTFALYVGDTNWNKNLPNIIQAIKKARVPLVIVSETFTKKLPYSVNAELISLRDAQDAARGISFIHTLGRINVTELVNLYQAARVLVMPSFWEGFGLPVVEAFASGCPVITSVRGGLAEITNTAALVVDPDDVDAIAGCIKRVFTNEDLYHKLAQSGRVQAQKFSWERTAHATEKVYKTILKI